MKSLEIDTVFCNIFLFNCSIRYQKCKDGTYNLACLTLTMILLYAQAILATLAIILGVTKGADDW